jgi:hypothetical protein
MDRIIQSMKNFLTILPRFLASDVGRGLLSTTPLSSSTVADTQQTTETFLALETALQQVQTARTALEPPRTALEPARTALEPACTALEPPLAAGAVRQPAEFKIVGPGIDFKTLKIMFYYKESSVFFFIKVNEGKRDSNTAAVYIN